MQSFLEVHSDTAGVVGFVELVVETVRTVVETVRAAAVVPVVGKGEAEQGAGRAEHEQGADTSTLRNGAVESPRISHRIGLCLSVLYLSAHQV